MPQLEPVTTIFILNEKNSLLLGSNLYVGSLGGMSIEWLNFYAHFLSPSGRMIIVGKTKNARIETLFANAVGGFWPSRFIMASFHFQKRAGGLARSSARVVSQLQVYTALNSHVARGPTGLCSG